MRATQRITSSRPGAGRPTREQAEQRHVELLDLALELFLEKGFELVTIDAVAAAVGMTKRTVYGLYEDKRALFKAAVQRAIERWIVPTEALRAVETDDLETTLKAIARIRLANAISPAGLRLLRVINAESYRFPEIPKLAYEQGQRPTIDYIADLLRRRHRAGEIKITRPELAAISFLGMVVGPMSRGMGWTGQRDAPGADEIEDRIRYSVRLFLDGARRR
jgi:TetR/AcrR family transcriptional regulator, mexJK operon transcriptional repressor